MSRVFWFLIAPAIVAISFLVTDTLIEAVGNQDERSRNATRIQTATTVMLALETYKKSRGTYPVLPKLDVPMSDLSGPLGIPISNLPGTEPSRYISPVGTIYGLLIRREGAGNCIVEVGA
jgi:hypothetical protein